MQPSHQTFDYKWLAALFNTVAPGSHPCIIGSKLHTKPVKFMIAANYELSAYSELFAARYYLKNLYLEKSTDLALLDGLV